MDPRRGALIKSLWRHFSFFSMYLTLGVVATAYLGRELVREAIADARIEAYNEAKEAFDADYKQRLLENKDYLGKACTTWWFDMTTKDRKLKVPGNTK